MESIRFTNFSNKFSNHSPLRPFLCKLMSELGDLYNRLVYLIIYNVNITCCIFLLQIICMVFITDIVNCLGKIK